jgi:hypothetical protein
MAWFSKSGAEMARQGMITEFREQQNMNTKLFIFELWKCKVTLTLNFKKILQKKRNKYLFIVFKAFKDNSNSFKDRIHKWNEVSKRLKYWLFEKIYEKLDLQYESDIVTRIIEQYMKPNLKYENIQINHIHRSRFGEYIWKPNLFEIKVFSDRQIRCNECKVNRKMNDIIPCKKSYFSLCSCNRNYCRKCFKKCFVKNNKIKPIIKCGCCKKDIYSDYIYKHRSGFSRFDLSKLCFNMYWHEYHLTVEFYDINKNFKNSKNIIYIIKLSLINWGTVYNNVSIQDICRYILFLRWYYRKTVHKEIIIFSKFYHLVNEILEYIYVDPITILRNNHSYKNPRKMLEVFLVLDSINKYY